MFKNIASGVALAGLLFGALTNATGQSSNTEARRPVLLELFTSEGCSSCPPADKLLQALDKMQPVSGADLIVLSEHVDYWNQSGWSDPFSSPAFSARQREYATRFGLDSVYTPQLIVDGKSELVGSDASGARNAIRKALNQQKVSVKLSNVSRQGDQVSVHVELGADKQPHSKATLYVAIADDQDHSDVRHGENAGRALTHVAVTRALLPVGTVGDQAFSKDLTIPVKSASGGGMRVIAFLQDANSHGIIGATQVKL